MAFRLVHARYDRETERAYVELRDLDDDGGEMLATAIFSYRTMARLSKREIEQDVVRKAPHLPPRLPYAEWGLTRLGLGVPLPEFAGRESPLRRRAALGLGQALGLAQEDAHGALHGMLLGHLVLARRHRLRAS
jgi:hypothetical protein